ncbi:hypothetical protein, partial [Rhodoferax sp.]|uniref:hypothetical protein n=1 Tax=Rhodoferax sp. TaxID=50421 RepID=UPI002600C589
LTKYLGCFFANTCGVASKLKAKTMGALICAPDLDPFALICKRHYRTCQRILEVWSQAMQ